MSEQLPGTLGLILGILHQGIGCSENQHTRHEKVRLALEGGGFFLFSHFNPIFNTYILLVYLGVRLLYILI